MIMALQRTALRLALIAATALTALPARADEAAPAVTTAPVAALEDQFRDPPMLRSGSVDHRADDPCRWWLGDAALSIVHSG